MANDVTDGRETLEDKNWIRTSGPVRNKTRTGSEPEFVCAYLLRLESSSQLVLLVLLPDLDVVDLVLVQNHQGEWLVVLLPGAVPHQVRPILETEPDCSEVHTGSTGPYRFYWS